MKTLVLGGGGREHALAWKLRQSSAVDQVLALPGNDGMAASGIACLPGDASDVAAVLAAARTHGAGLIVVGPEAPLAAGVSDALREAGMAVFGPSQAAAQLESSKVFAKAFMARHGIPTARFAAVDSPAAARRSLAGFGGVAVLKADGLAAGKGVVVPETAAEAEAAAEALLSAYGRLVIEERLRGPELSLLTVSNGEQYVTLLPARDHKRLQDGDRGPNTGGMGAVAGEALIEPALRSAIEQTVIEPTLQGMRAEGTPFTGVLYCGVMLTAEGPRVLEYNVRFGDPETQAILPCWRADLAALLDAAARGRTLPPRPADASGWGACVVAAAAGYPGTPRRGDPIAGLNAGGQTSAAEVFHAGTRLVEGAWRTNGGRVLAVAAQGGSQEKALDACYGALSRIQFRGMQVRRDIGQSTRRNASNA